MRYVFSTLMVLVVAIKGIAQQSASFKDLIDVSTKPPEVASLGKFGNIPVSNCTGVPGITIPVYEINIGKIKLPISLDYHAGGIRVDETAGSVGLGWALSGIGIVSRNVVGIPDEGQFGFINAPDGQLVSMAPNSYSSYLYSLRHSQADAEPDIFQYSINGQSGKFIFNKDGTVMQIPVTNTKIVYEPGVGFTITDENGIVYIFHNKQLTTLSGQPESGITSYYSAWRLTKMVDANVKDTIYFTYETNCSDSYEHSTNFSYTIGVLGMECSMIQNADHTWAVVSTPSGTQANQSGQGIGHQEFYPKEITWRGGKISFVNNCDRLDVTGSGERLSEINIYANQNNAFTQVKNVKLYHTYFFSDPYGNPSEKNYRLKLDSVRFLPVNTTEQPQTYRMTYDGSPMPPRESYAQDRWGFNNGKFTNTSLMPKQTKLYKGMYYSFGDADRETDASKILACTINSIEYPTKGKSVFEFEPHQYKTDLPRIETKSVSCDAYGGVQVSTQTTFTVNSYSSGFRYNVFISKFNYPDVTDRPRVTMTDQTTGQQVLFVSTVPTNVTDQDYSTGTLAIDLVQGHTYLIQTNIYTSNSNVKATCLISWVETYPNIIEVKSGGGLRVKSITNYDLDGNFLNKDLYQYGDDNTGVILTPQYYQDINFEKVIRRQGCPGGTEDPTCKYFYEDQEAPVPGYSVIYHANSVFPTSQYSGSPVLYRKVTKYQVDAAGNTNGKTVYTYQVYQDGSTINNKAIEEMSPVGYWNTGIYLISDTWKNGLLLSEDSYKSTSAGYALISRTQNNYTIARINNQNVLKVKYSYLHAGCEFGSMTSSDEIKLFAVPINTGAVLLTSTTTTTWDNNGYPIVNTQNITYNGAPLLPSKKEFVNSKNETSTENFQYPGDLASPGNVYQKMVQRNIVSPVVQNQKLLNGVQQLAVTVNYDDWFGDTKILQPYKVDQQIAANPVETRVRFNKFDAYGNILQQQKDNDVFQSYIWDYQSVYPVAQCINADYNSIAYTSFEADGTGNWAMGSTTRSSGGITGNTCYQLLNGSITKTGLSAGTTYIVSYWTANNNPFTIAGTQGTVTQGKNIGGWKYFEHRVSGVTDITLPQTSGLIDELRLYPADAQMTTFTYAPLIGMTSGCSAKNTITYYQYDGLGRLKLIKDEDGNVIKTYEYHYKE
jgi:hypothetical protein